VVSKEIKQTTFKKSTSTLKIKIMKTQLTNILKRLTGSEMKVLAAHQQNETLATNGCNKKNFTSFDLWSIQKHKRVYGIRSFA